MACVSVCVGGLLGHCHVCVCVVSVCTCVCVVSVCMCVCVCLYVLNRPGACVCEPIRMGRREDAMRVESVWVGGFGPRWSSHRSS